MSSEVKAIVVEALGKNYEIYKRPRDRIKQLAGSFLRSLFRIAPVKYYTDFWALKNVSFDVKCGETVGIVGRNGSGKSTLLQLICGTLSPTTGIVRVRGRVAALLELGAGFNPDFTGRENVYMNATILGLTKDEIDDKFEEIAEFADIGEFIEQPVKHYSSGMFARLAFSVAISVDPNILIVDEALSVGDEPFQRKCYARMEEIKRRGGTILFVSHAASTVVSMCDKVLTLHRGQKIFFGDPKTAVGLYQKLANASETQQKTVIAESIRRHNDQANESSLEPFQELESNVADYYVQSGFEPSLITASKVNFEPKEVEIKFPRIVRNDGEVVNLLVAGENYRFEFDVELLSPCHFLRMYCMIKTMHGIELGGGVYPEEGETGVSANVGNVLKISFEFECNLGSGTYFINCGVAESGEISHRILDALMFKVSLCGNRHSMGLVDFKVKPTMDVS